MIGRRKGQPAEPAETQVPPLVDGGTELTRRRFTIRAIAAIGGACATVVAIPIAAMTTAAGWRARSPLRFLSNSIAPTLRSNDWSQVGALTDFEVGVPKHVEIERDIVDGWVTEHASIAAYVVRDSDTEARVLDPHCTHLGCPLSWSGGAGRFLCPCHGGAFGADGVPVSGPPPRPLDGYETRVDGGQVMIRTLLES
jgi:menaquinol-cytochrome c reductase iron-sulfur subunit